MKATAEQFGLKIEIKRYGLRRRIPKMRIHDLITRPVNIDNLCSQDVGLRLTPCHGLQFPGDIVHAIHLAQDVLNFLALGVILGHCH